MAHIGELLPAKSPANRGQGRRKKSSAPGAPDLPFGKHTLADYRKIAKFKAINAIQRGRFYSMAHIGALLPAKSRHEAGAMKGKKGSAPNAPPFSKPTLAERGAGRFYSMAHIGALLPAKSRHEAGAMKGKKGASPPEVPFAPATLATYRKINKFKDEIDPYFDGWEKR